MSPGCKNRIPQTNVALAKQVAQDLHLSSDGSDFENPEETNKDTPPNEDLQLLAGTTQTESGANPPGTPAPPNLTTPTSHPDEDLGAGESAIPTQEEKRDAGQTSAQPATSASNRPPPKG